MPCSVTISTFDLSLDSDPVVTCDVSVLDHFDKNRVERRMVGVDTRISKVTQKLEDRYAAEYREQLRLDQ